MQGLYKFCWVALIWVSYLEVRGALAPLPRSFAVALLLRKRIELVLRQCLTVSRPLTHAQV